MKIWDWLLGRSKTQEEQAPLPPPPKKIQTKYVLCLDGGGMRGIIPIQILIALEKKLNQNGFDGRISDYFDMIAGTSTGGLIALSLTCRHSMTLEEVEKTYMSSGPVIFPQHPNTYLGLRMLVSEKYSADGLISILSKWFGDSQLGCAEKPTMLIAYDLSKGEEKLFRSWEESDIPVLEAARATSAAPTYFAPLIKNDMMLADGGIIANNPAVFAYFEAKKLWPDADRIVIVSISTAGTVHKMKPDSVSGVLNWADNIVPMYGTAQKRTTDYVLKNLKDVSYIRIDGQMAKGYKLDDASPRAMSTMRAFGQNLAREYDSVLNDLAALLGSREPSDAAN